VVNSASGVVAQGACFTDHFGWGADCSLQGGPVVHLKIKNPADFCCAVLFVALGAFAMYWSRDYEMGTALAMGPGYFPTWLGGILIGFGVAIGALAFIVDAEQGSTSTDDPWVFRPWLVLPLTLIVFGLMMNAEVGFVPSLLALVAGCSLAHKDVHWKETVVLSVLVTAGAVAIFSFGIGLPYRLFWWDN
jgi:hypothetical protein